MGMMKKVLMVTALAATVETAAALPSIRLETSPTVNQGAVEMDELGPSFARPLPEDQPASVPDPKPQPQVEAKNEKKNDILSLFRDDQQPKEKEVNPLEEMAKNEMKTMGDPENRPSGEQQIVQVGENNKQPELDIKADNAPKEIDLESATGDGKNLPGLK